MIKPREADAPATLVIGWPPRPEQITGPGFPAADGRLGRNHGDRRNPAARTPRLVAGRGGVLADDPAQGPSATTIDTVRGAHFFSAPLTWNSAIEFPGTLLGITSV